MSKTQRKPQISAKIKKARTRYTCDKKINILNQLKESNLSVLAFSKKINIPVRTIQDWKKNESNILAAKKKPKKLEKVISQY